MADGRGGAGSWAVRPLAQDHVTLFESPSGAQADIGCRGPLRMTSGQESVVWASIEPTRGRSDKGTGEPRARCGYIVLLRQDSAPFI